MNIVPFLRATDLNLRAWKVAGRVPLEMAKPPVFGKEKMLKIFPKRAEGWYASNRVLCRTFLRYFKLTTLITFLFCISLTLYPLFFTTPVLASSATLAPTSGDPGTEITVTGYTLGKYQSGWVWFDSDGDSIRDAEEPQQEVTTNLFGYFQTTFTAPSVAAGDYYVRVDVPSGDVIEHSPVFTIVASSYVISLDPTSGIGGTEITVTGSGFSADTAGWVWFDSNNDSIRDASEPQTPVTTDGTGAIPAGTTVNAALVEEGTYSVRADIPDGGSVETSADFTILPPVMTLDPDEGVMNAIITLSISGEGFIANTAGWIWFDTDGDGIKDGSEPQTAVTTTAGGAIPTGTTLDTPLLPPKSSFQVYADIPDGGDIEASAGFTTSNVTNEVIVTKYAADGTTVLSQIAIDYPTMQSMLPVCGNGTTHYYMHGPTFDDTSFDALWDPVEMVNIDSRDYGAAMGTNVKDLCDLVGGAAPGDTIQIKAVDNFYKWFDYEDVYNPEPEQGKMILTWYTTGTVEGSSGNVGDGSYDNGMRLLFFAETLNPEGKYVHGIWDMHEYLPASRWHYYYDGDFWPSSSGLSVKWVRYINIYQPPLISCDVSGNPKDSFESGETVYVKGVSLDSTTGYKLWIQGEPVLLKPLDTLDRPGTSSYVLNAGNDPSGAQETVATDGNGDFGPTAIWTIAPGTTANNYDIVADNQVSGTMGEYESEDGIDCPGWQGFAVTVPSEVISFTVTDYNDDGIKFGSLDPGQDDQPADGQPSQSAVTITVEQETNVDVNVRVKGTDFSGDGTITIGNVTYNNENNPGEASAMPSDYTTWYTVTQPLTEDHITPVYYWISIDSGQNAGTYTSTFSYEVVKAE